MLELGSFLSILSVFVFPSVAPYGGVPEQKVAVITSRYEYNLAWHLLIEYTIQILHLKAVG